MSDHDQGEEPADLPKPQPPSRPDVTPQESLIKTKRISALFAFLVSLIVFISVVAVSMALGFAEEASWGAASAAFIISMLVLFLISARRRRKEAGQEQGELGIFSAEEYEELQHFVGPRTDTTDYYLPRWKTGKNGFNGAGCILGVFWLLYRKMYQASFIAAGIILFFQLAALAAPSSSPSSGLRGLGYWVALFIGCFGNSWYLSRARKVINKARTECAADGEFRRDVFLEKISKRGGVSWVPPFVYILFIVLSIYFPYYISNPQLSWPVVSKQNDSVYYTNEATEADARKVMKALTELEFFGQGGADVRVDVTPGGRCSVSFVLINEGFITNPAYLAGFQEVGEYISQDLGRSLSIDLCVDNFKVQKSIHIEYEK